MRNALLRVPFTVVLELAILILAFWNGSALGRLGDEVHRAWGFGPLTFWHGRWHTLATNTLLVRNALMLLGMILFVAGSLGVYEWRAGTRRALAVFWSANVLTLLVTTACVVVPMRLMGVPPTLDWAPAGDVGASFGGFGCLGAWMVGVPGRRRALVAIVLAGLVVKFLIYPEIFGDAGHIVAFLSGIALGALFERTGQVH